MKLVAMLQAAALQDANNAVHQQLLERHHALAVWAQALWVFSSKMDTAAKAFYSGQQDFVNHIRATVEAEYQVKLSEALSQQQGACLQAAKAAEQQACQAAVAQVQASALQAQQQREQVLTAAMTAAEQKVRQAQQASLQAQQAWQASLQQVQEEKQQAQQLANKFQHEAQVAQQQRQIAQLAAETAMQKEQQAQPYANRRCHQSADANVDIAASKPQPEQVCSCLTWSCLWFQRSSRAA